MKTADTERGRKPLVLVVEDDELSQTYVATVLRSDFDTLLAASGAQARAHLAAHADIAVVLMDISLKGDEDGLQLTRWLRADSRWKDLPIIATTAHALVEDQRASLAAGCTAHLSKPISPEALLEAVRQALPGAPSAIDDGVEESAGSTNSTILLLRWALIIATAYLIVFHRPLSDTPPIVALFVAFYLASNLAVGFLMRRLHATRGFLIGVVFFDTMAVSLALLLTQKATSDFFLLYFVVMLIGTVTENLVSVLTAAFLISVVHLSTVAHFLGARELIRSGHLVQVPFLFVVGLFFGHLVQRARKAERAAEDSRAQRLAQSDFVAMLARDIKSPLSAVLGLADILREEPPENRNERRQLMDGIDSSAHQAVTLATNFVDAVRLESGSLQLQRNPGSLNAVVEHALGSMLHFARTRGITMETVLRPDLPDLDLDERAFDRVVVNLLSNAIKFTPKNGEVRVETAVRKNRVVLSVRDRCSGIAPEDRQKLFRRFSSLRGAQQENTGLGLFIVKTITEAHGAEVRVDCPPDGGTVFEVSFAVPIQVDSGRGHQKNARATP